ncbi:MAG: ribose-phosphate diphosphokinase [Candidatus Pacebacteria bacterium]|nr:ribose-phosphate diphosphokinase [Candidatus Paceibacterota bacterium]
MDKVVIGDDLGKKLGQELKMPFISFEDRIFNDGEVQPRLAKEEKTKEAILIIQKKQKENINSYLVKYLLLLRKIRDLSQKTIAIMPYLPYSRQDSVFREGEPLSSLYLAELIEKNTDVFLTCNMHEHRKKIRDLFKIPAYNVFLFEEMAEKFKEFSPSNTIVIGPDREAEAFVDNFCRNFPASKLIFEKHRNKETGKVNFIYPENTGDILKGKEVIIVDDIVSTGGTILETAKIIKQFQIKTINFAFVHSIFGDEVIDRLAIIGPKKIIFTNTLENLHYAVDIIKPLARYFLEHNLGGFIDFYEK